MSLTIVPASPHHGRQLQLRPQDSLEVSLALPGVDPGWAVEASIRSSDEAWAAIDGDAVVAVWGYSVADHLVGPWMLCSSSVGRYGRLALRVGRHLVSHLSSQFRGRVIGNHVARSNPSARAFIQRLGFVILPTPGSADFDFFYLPCALTQEP